MIKQSSLLLERKEIVHGFSTRTGGVSQGPWASLNLAYNVGDNPAHVKENFDRLSLLCKVEEIVTATQVHQSRVLLVTSDNRAEDAASEEADGLITKERGIAVGVRTADCVPVLLFDPKTSSIGALHAGWRGTVGGIISSGVSRMVKSFGIDPCTTLASIGPSIRDCCFKIDQDIADRLETTAPGTLNKRGADFFADLALANRDLLVRQGLAKEHIEIIPGCTFCSRELYYSHRRDRGVTGRHLAFICLKKK